MADNVGYTPGSGATIAADDIGSVLYQRVKIGVGADGASTDLTGDASGANVQGSVANDAVDAGNPNKIGGRARSTEPSDVAADDRTDGYFDLKGRLVVAAKAGTGTGSNVSASATSVTLLSANTARLGATIYNDSTVLLYVKMGTTASTTDFWVKITAGGYAEIPFGYTGRLDGIWASATGTARIVELT